MITLEANVHASQCNTCNGRDDVLAARFRAPGSSGSVIVALCRTCRAEAVGVLATLPPDPAPTGEVARRLAVVEEAVRQAVTDLNFAAATRSIMLVDRAIDDLNAVIHTEQP